MKRTLVFGNVVAIVLVVSYGVVEYGSPLVATRLWSDSYKELMFKCDHVMREHYIAKRAVQVGPSSENVRNLEATEVGLLDCHEYDKLRKRLLVWGVSENMLASIGLEALEEKQYELQEFVKIHEIRY